MEKHYETVCIVRTDIGEEAIKAAIQKSKTAVEGLGGRIDRVDEWGRRKLAYPIQKKNEGFYFVMNYFSKPEASKELERLLKYNEDVIRYQTVRLESFEAAKPKKEETPVQAAPAAGAEDAGGGPAGANPQGRQE